MNYLNKAQRAKWREMAGDRGTVIGQRDVAQSDGGPEDGMSDSKERTCHAGPPGPWHPAGINYGKPHVPVGGSLNGRPALTCLYCGRTL